MRNYIGLACSMHDPAIAIVNSLGEVVFAEAAERYLQNKRAYNSPPDDFIRMSKLIGLYCGDNSDLVVATTWQSKWLRRVRFGLAPFPFFTGLADRLTGRKTIAATYSSVRSKYEHTLWAIRSLSNSASQAALNLKELALLDDLGHKARGEAGPVKGLSGRRLLFTDFDHHLTHAAAACYASPFPEAVCAVFDTRGERGSSAFYTYRNGRLNRIKSPPSRASLGQFYSLLCFACGFDPIKGEEWKVMGLAAHGQMNEEVYRKLQALFSVRQLQLVRRNDRRPVAQVLAELQAWPRETIAFAGQKVFADVMGEMLNNLFGLGLSENLVLEGGCALNSSNNGKIVSKTGFKHLFVPSAPADDGNAVGAAWLAFQQDHPDWRPTPGVLLPYLGSSMSKETIDRMLKLGRVANLSRMGDQIHKKAAQLLADGRIVAWIQGRAEFGPRALGNRSLLADPRRAEMKDIINERVKFREEFRPFAPSILHEFGSEYFENYQESPYMERTLKFKEEVRSKVPAVVHVDGTGRLQTVKREWNRDFHELIAQFHKITGIPLILNTSLNIMGKPIAHSVEDAVGLFYTTGLDVLVIGDVLIEKKG